MRIRQTTFLTHSKYVSSFPLECFTFFHLIPYSIWSKHTILNEQHSVRLDSIIFFCGEVTLKLVLTSSRREFHYFWRSIRSHKEWIVSQFLFLPACGKAFIEYERDLQWPDLANEYEGAAAECIFTFSLLLKSHLSDLFSVAYLVLSYGIQLARFHI